MLKRKLALMVMVIEGMGIDSNLSNLSSTSGTTSLSPFLPMTLCSCLPFGISVGRKTLDVNVFFLM